MATEPVLDAWESFEYYSATAVEEKPDVFSQYGESRSALLRRFPNATGVDGVKAGGATIGQALFADVITRVVLSPTPSTDGSKKDTRAAKDFEREALERFQSGLGKLPRPLTAGVDLDITGFLKDLKANLPVGGIAEFDLAKLASDLGSVLVAAPAQPSKEVEELKRKLGELDQASLAQASGLNGNLRAILGPEPQKIEAIKEFTEWIRSSGGTREPQWKALVRVLLTPKFGLQSSRTNAPLFGLAIRNHFHDL